MTKNLLYLLLFAIVLHACSNTKYLPKGEKLYTGGEVKIVSKDIKKNDSKLLNAQLEALLRPQPNGAFLGLRPGLYLWNITQTKKKKGLAHWLHSKGSPPVLVSSVDLDKNSQILTNRLQNESYFQAQVIGDTVSKGRTAKAVYTANIGPAYKIRKITFPTGKENIDTAVAGTASQSLLKVGDKYDLDVIKNERLRIDARLKEKGFYYFSPENLIMRIDSTIENHQVDIIVKIKDETPDKARVIYTINNIYVYPSYSLRDTSLKLDSALKYRWFYVVDPKKTIRPMVFKNTVLLHPGEVYNRTDHTKSLNRFIELGPFKFVKNRFEDVSTKDSAKLNVFYDLSKYPRKSIQLDLLGRTTSADYNGTQVSVSWKNRSAFKGAELLTITAFGSTDGQVGGSNGNYPVSQLGLQASLSWPRFISPWNFKADNAYIPHTVLTIGYSVVIRSQLYTLNSYSASYGYQWKQTERKSHQLNLLNLNYVNPRSVTQKYLDSISSTGNPQLKHVIDRQFSFGPSYSYTYTNTTESARINSIYYNGKVSLSNNLLGIITQADTPDHVKKIFGIPFSQYAKFENEIRYFHKVGLASTVAARVMVGIGVPYGNSTILPYSQQFFAGGPNDLRGFRARSVGPGVVDPYQYAQNKTDFLPDASGDIRIESTVEYRPKLFSIVYGALFADAGNVWNMKNQPGQEGGTFGKNFISQMAVDAGFGLRFDLTVLVLRTDMGFPLIKPWEPDRGTKFGGGIFNLAIGYPF